MKGWMSLRNLEEMMSGRGLSVDHSTCIGGRSSCFRWHKRPVGKSWRKDETYIEINGHWQYPYRAVDKDGDTVDFMLHAHRGSSDEVPEQRSAALS